MCFVITSCSDISSDNADTALNSLNKSSRNEGKGRGCAAMDVLEENMKEDPSLKDKMDDVEKQTKDFEKKMKGGRVGATGTLIIPVVVNVLYANANENISNAQIQSQIDVLNRDFSATNPDLGLVPSAFTSAVSNLEYQFTLSSIIRKSSNKTSWGTRDAMKNAKKGGINPTSPTTTLNI